MDYSQTYSKCIATIPFPITYMTTVSQSKQEINSDPERGNKMLPAPGIKPATTYRGSHPSTNLATEAPH